MTTKTDKQTAGELLLKVESGLSSLEKRIAEIQAEICECESAGMENANEHWKSGKYLYLVYPVDGNGYRRRQYIGNDPEAIKLAQEAVKRYKRWVTLQAKIRVLHERYQYVITQLSNILYHIKGVQTKLWREE